MAKIKIDSDDKKDNVPVTEDPVQDEAPSEHEEETTSGDAGSAEEDSLNGQEKPEAQEDTEAKNQSFFHKKRQKETSKKEKELTEKLEKTSGELDDLNNRFIRLMADFDNYKKRSVRESEAKYLDSKADTMKKFLPVMDAFERALKTEVPEEAKAYTQGYEMIYGIIKKIFDDNGVEEIKALGETFDPNLHNAVMHVDDENLGENTVAEVFEKGYRMGDRILRYSIVKVAN